MGFGRGDRRQALRGQGTWDRHREQETGGIGWGMRGQGAAKQREARQPETDTEGPTQVSGYHESNLGTYLVHGVEELVDERLPQEERVVRKQKAQHRDRQIEVHLQKGVHKKT